MSKSMKDWCKGKKVFLNAKFLKKEVREVRGIFLCVLCVFVGGKRAGASPFSTFNSQLNRRQPN